MKKITLCLLGCLTAAVCLYVAETDFSAAHSHTAPASPAAAVGEVAPSLTALPATASPEPPAVAASPMKLVAAQAGLHDIPALSQLPELPNGCEAVAATMLMNWAGLPISKDEVAEALPKGDLPYTNEDGAMVGGNPRDVFVGDPFDVGYGIYHAPVAKLMEQWLPGRVKNLTGASLEALLAQLAQGRPVMVWATEHMDTPYLDLTWEDPDGELVDWYQPEHALLLVGVDDGTAYLNDPMTGQQEAYDLDAFHQAWEAMGSQAITITPAQP
ncbi:C39 family peptidase [Paenibacillus oryzisoli]|uniref:Peptidase C39-like domain-containing protein n=1 Tax=Paenibacillus oryzisoli TaxID=1850517 RepID=A0A198AHE8_9BACL|nr:C39 family peptidase [Paenibacillus oryzisoli]OAS20627.1 hypothetical protein A8708_18975 [Paenibacillus oryzisoli]